MKSLRLRFLLAVSAVLLGSALMKAQAADDTPPPAMHRHAYGMGRVHMMEFKKLNLTDDQKTQMKAIMQKEHPAMKPLYQQERQIDLQLRQYGEGTFDAAKVQTLAAQKAQIQTQITVAETRIHNQMYQLLTSEQQAQLKQMEANHEARMQQRMEQHEAPAPPEQ